MKLRSDVTFRGAWPITDEDADMRSLIDEAIGDLPQLATDAGAVLVGRPRWRTDENDDGTLILVCEVPAWRSRTHTAHLAEVNAAARVGESLVPFTPCTECDRPAGRLGLCLTHRAQVTRAAAKASAA